MPLVRTMRMVRIIEQHNATAGKRDKVAAVRLLKDLTIKHQLGFSVHNDATSKRDDVMEPLRGTGEIVRRGNDRASTCGLIVEHVHDLLLRHWVDTSHWLVE